MIDLQPAIREYILADSFINSSLPNFSGSKTVFTRRPVPENVSYPLILVSPLVADQNQDYLRCERHVLNYDISVYGLNDAAENYRLVEAIANRLQSIFHRMPGYALNMPSGSKLIKSVATGPLSGAVDDENKVGRVVICEFDVSF